MTEAVYNDHAIRSTLQQILAMRDDEEFLKLPTPLNDDQQWCLSRVFEFARLVAENLRQTPSTLVSVAQLNALQGTMVQVLAELSNFRSNKNPGHLTNASSQIDSTGISQERNAFATIADIVSGNTVGLIVDDLRKASQNVVKSLAKDKESLEQNIRALTAQVSDQAKQVNELTTAVEAQKKEAVAVIAVVEGKYAKTETELLEKFNSRIEEISASFKEFQDKSVQAADSHLDVLNNKEVEAKRIVQVVGNIGVTGNYQKIAESESKAANLWRNATIAFFTIGVIVALIAFIVHFFHGSTPENFWTFAMRFVTAIAIASPAFYTARESARHRSNADRARQRELELASLGPFIELLPKDQKEAITSKLVERYFGNEVESHEARQPFDIKDATELVKATMDGAVKIAKS